MIGIFPRLFRENPLLGREKSSYFAAETIKRMSNYLKNTIMKKMLFTLVLMLTTVAQTYAMTYEQARNEALFLTDKMAYELNLSDAQYEAAYEINLDYLMGVTSYNDVYGPYWERRNLDLSYILYQWQWDAFRTATYFYRPLYWDSGYWHFGIYARYPHRDYFYFGRPHFYLSYRGGHSWRMNGGRSYYEGRHHFFRPDRPRDQHFGMRNGWDRGDYRGNHGGHSSTRITVDNDRFNHGSNHSGHNHNGGFGSGHRNNNNVNENPSNHDSNRGLTSPHNSGNENRHDNHSFGGNHSSSHNNSSHSSGSFGGNRSHGGSSFGGTRSGGGSMSGNHSGHSGSGSRGGGSGSFGGSRSGRR